MQEGFRVMRDAQSVAALRDALERRGAREGHLAATLDRHLDAILRGMPGQALRCAAICLCMPGQDVRP